MTVVLKGLAELTRKFEAIEKGVDRELDRVLKESADVVRDEAKERAPVRTGKLRDSIISRLERASDFFTNARRSALVVVQAPHGHLVEFGTAPHKIDHFTHPGARENPFLFPAFEAKREEIIQSIMAAKLRGAIKGAVR